MEPGYRRIRVAPVPGGGITAARSSLESPFGPIEVAWQFEEGVLELDLSVPNGVTAGVVLPDGTRVERGGGDHHFTSHRA